MWFKSTLRLHGVFKRIATSARFDLRHEWCEGLAYFAFGASGCRFEPCRPSGRSSTVEHSRS
jgi:hypothetical protein